MSAAVPTTEPLSLIVGDTLLFTRSVKDYPASDGWTLVYNFESPDGVNVFTFNATPSGADYSVNVTAAITATWTAGLYQGAAKVTNVAGQAFTVWQGTLRLLPSLAAGGTDIRSHAKKVLDNLEAVMEGRATDDVLDSIVEGTQIRRLPIEQLLLLMDRYKAIYRGELARERVKNGRGSGRNIFVRIGAPGGNPNWPYNFGVGGQR